MKQRLFLFATIFGYWIFFFLVCRGIFLLYHLPLTRSLSFAEVVTVFFYGARMDAAMAGYWSILPALLLVASFFWGGLFIRAAIAVAQLVLLVGSSVLTVVDLELYRHWGFRLDATPLFYLSDEGFGSVSQTTFLVTGTLLVLLAVAFAVLFRRVVYPQLASLRAASGWWALVFVPLVAGLVIPIRGGLGQAPLNSGMAYFHPTKAFANHAGINATWNFLKSVSAGTWVTYPENLTDRADAERQLQELTATAGMLPVVDQPRPNILFIILESFTGSIVEPMGGLPGVTPRLNKLIAEGILFDQIYASGDRTDKGLVSIFSGYPAQPRSSIIKLPKKTQRLPFLTHDLRELGYHSSFVYGGDIHFANMNSYLTVAGFAPITNKADMPDSVTGSKWGAQDGVMFRRLLAELDTARSPFFKSMLTISSHEPFDVPLRSAWYRPDDARAQFLNSCYYADSVLGAFMDQARTKAWWQNSLVIITADHGHRFPDQQELKEKKRFRIPLLLLGGAVTKRDTVIHSIGSQTDLAPTLLAQLGYPANHYPFGKNLLARQLYPFAVYIFKNGYGYVSDAGECVYDFDLGGYYKNKLAPADRERAAAYMQALFLDFNKR